jgi:hypothetical protein
LGSFHFILKDQAGNSTVSFVGEPQVAAPGSLGASARLVEPGVLLVSIVASDTLNIEPITITGLAIRTTDEAAIGPLVATADDFDGSLGAGLAAPTLSSPGSVVALP